MRVNESSSTGNNAQQSQAGNNEQESKAKEMFAKMMKTEGKTADRRLHFTA